MMIHQEQIANSQHTHWRWHAHTHKKTVEGERARGLEGLEGKKNQIPSSIVVKDRDFGGGEVEEVADPGDPSPFGWDRFSARLGQNNSAEMLSR